MTYEEAIKNLMELQMWLINDNSEEAIEYNKKIYDTFAYFITQTIPLSVIEEIKAEIKNIPITEERDMATYWDCRDDVLGIIDRKVNEVTNE